MLINSVPMSNLKTSKNKTPPKKSNPPPDFGIQKWELRALCTLPKIVYEAKEASFVELCFLCDSLFHFQEFLG